ncbi:Hpt domain-containing protein, partial [Desulfobacterales bacterium HSG2]|nr:Hpt domain-containing protein [Desulfobacterales bacterium HSG2]
KELFAVLRRNIPQMRNAEYGMRNETAPEFKIPTLPGMDIREGLERLGGSWDLYVNIFEDFCKAQKGFVSEFQEFVRKKDFKAARAKAHALKGASGNVSAVDLGIAARALEDTCKNENEEQILSMLALVESELTQAMKNVSVLTQYEENVVKSEETDDVPLDPTEIPELLEKFDKSLEDFDPVESKACLSRLSGVADHFPGISDKFKADMEDLTEQIKTYNFDDARETLSRLADEILS